MDSKKEHSLTCEKCRKITTKITGDGGMTYGCSLFPGIVVGREDILETWFSTRCNDYNDNKK